MHSKRSEPPRNGSGWLERKANGELVYHTPWLKKSKPFRETKSIAEPKARIETPTKALARMRKECVTPEYCLKRVGKTCPDGFQLTATNGHWALLEPTGKGTVAKPDMANIGNLKGYHASFIDSPEFFLALNRAKVMASDTSRTVHLIGEKGMIHLYSSHSLGLVFSGHACLLVGIPSGSGEPKGHRGNNDAGDFQQSVKAVVTKPWKAAMDYTYLETALGVWPLTVWVKDDESAESAVIFEPASREWRFVVMPMRADWDTIPAPFVPESEAPESEAGL